MDEKGVIFHIRLSIISHFFEEKNFFKAKNLKKEKTKKKELNSNY